MILNKLVLPILILNLTVLNGVAQAMGTDGRGGFFAATDVILKTRSELAQQLNSNKTKIESELKENYGAINIDILVEAIKNTRVLESTNTDIKRNDIQGRFRPIKLDYGFNKNGQPEIIWLPSAVSIVEAQLDDNNQANEILKRKIERSLIKEASHFLNYSDDKADPFAKAVAAVIGGYSKKINYNVSLELMTSSSQWGSGFVDISNLVKELSTQFPNMIAIVKSQADLIEVLVKPHGTPVVQKSRVGYPTDQYHLIFKINNFGAVDLEIAPDSIVGRYKLAELAEYCHSKLMAGDDEEYLSIKDCYEMKAEFVFDKLQIKFSPNGSIKDDDDYAAIQLEFIRKMNGAGAVSIFIESGDDDYGSQVYYNTDK